MPDVCADLSEDLIIDKFDELGVRWVKVYVGGGLHFDNWLEQYKEVYGDANVLVEEIAAPKNSCYAQGGEKLFRIWIKQKQWSAQFFKILYLLPTALTARHVA